MKNNKTLKRRLTSMIAMTAAFCIAFAGIPFVSGGPDSYAVSKSKITLKVTSKNSKVTLKWNKINKPGNGYAVFRNGKVLKRLGKNKTTYVDKVSKKKNYKYVIKVYKISKVKKYYNKKNKKWQFKRPAKKYIGKTKWVKKYTYSKPSNTVKVVADDDNWRDDSDIIDKPDVSCDRYSYEIIPLTAPFNSWFYIKTDNPDPDSFAFIDESTIYDKKEGTITPYEESFADVKYEKKSTLRVSGGYIAYGSDTDGGEIRLCGRKVTGKHSVYDLSTGETTIEKDYASYNTNKTVTVGQLKDVTDYLIDTYGDSEKSFFDNMSAIEDGFSKECLYSGVYVLGKLKKSESTPYCSLSTSPHADQTFYIQDPYYREDGKYMFVSELYPLIFDSIGFPSVMASVATRLNSNATVEWNDYYHYLVDVTLDGTTRSYGGAGTGEGQGINENQIKYRFIFDGSETDAYKDLSISNARTWIREYSEMEVPDEERDTEPLTWASVRSTVGTDGSYVRLTLITSIFGFTSTGFTFLYDDGSDDEGSDGWGAVGSFTNAWYDGRYFNDHEYYYPGAAFEDTVEKVQPSIIIKDPVIRLPDDGKTYYYQWDPITEVPYDPETGVWKGFMTYYYDEETQTWCNDLAQEYGVTYREAGSYKYNTIDDPDFIAACTITMEEALAMNLDANTNVEPTGYYIYDGQSVPGTKH